MRISLLLFALVIITNSICAQKIAQIENINDVKAHLNVLEEKHPGFMREKLITKVYKLDANHTKIVYDENGIHTEELVYNPLGKMIIIATFLQISEAVVPPIVKDGFLKLYKSKNNVKAYYEVRPLYGGPHYYAVEYLKNQTLERAYFTSLGRPRKGPR